eukprot:3128481-Rhodomonas_salina.1
MGQHLDGRRNHSPDHLNAALGQPEPVVQIGQGGKPLVSAPPPHRPQKHGAQPPTDRRLATSAVEVDWLISPATPAPARAHGVVWQSRMVSGVLSQR